jgi:hypothetical protein
MGVLAFFSSTGFGLLALLWVWRSMGRKVRNAPRTPESAFRPGSSGAALDLADRLRLSSTGLAVLVFGIPVGLIALGLSWGTGHRLLEDYRSEQAPQSSAVIIDRGHGRSRQVRYRFEVDGRVYEGSTADDVGSGKRIAVRYLASDPSRNWPVKPAFPISVALLMPAMLDGIFLWLMWKLWRDYLLITKGHLTLGILLGYVGNTGAPWRLADAYYDFIDNRRYVTRGHSMLGYAGFSRAIAGSMVEVVYLPDNIGRNALRGSLCWEV